MRRYIAILAIGVIIAIAATATGHVENLINGSGGITPIAWPAGAFITYFHNNQTSAALPNLSPGSNPQGAINNAFQTIGAETGLTFVNGGTTSTASVGVDGVNLVTFANTPTNNAAVSGAVALAIFTYNTSSGVIAECDIVFNPFQPFDTNGGFTSQDVESVAAHEIGHFVGQEHSPCLHATMFPFNGNGRTLNRTLSEDDKAGLRTLYPSAGSSSFGTFTGLVQRGPGQPVFGAHVTVQDHITGETVTGGVTLPDGTFEIAGVRPGVYNLFVEPLDGPYPALALSGGIWNPGAFDTTFQTTFLGGNSDPREVSLVGGQTRTVGTITVGGPTPALNPSFIALTPTPNGFLGAAGLAVTAAAGYSQYLVIGGPGFDLFPDAAFSLEGPFLSITGASTLSGNVGPGNDFKIFPISIANNTPEGGYAVRVTQGSEIAFLTGAIDVTAATPQAWAQPYLQSCNGSLGPVTLGAIGTPSLGNAAFAMTVGGTLGGNVGYLFLSLVPAATTLPLGSACRLGLDINNLLVPFPGQTFSLTAAVTTLSVPIPNDPTLSGLTFYAQFAAVDAGAPLFNLGISNPLALHVR